MSTPLPFDLVAQAAGNKFGQLIAQRMTRENHLGMEFILLIKRDHAPMQDRPYMTIRGFFFYQDGKPGFEHGHYDMREHNALEDFNAR